MDVSRDACILTMYPIFKIGIEMSNNYITKKFSRELSKLSFNDLRLQLDRWNPD